MHLAPIVKTTQWPDEAGTRDFARRLAGYTALRDCYIALHGDLGAGKTTLVRHLLQALGVTGRIKSPTYAVVEPYDIGPGPGRPQALAVWHFDFYRFQDPREWEDAGFRDIFASPGLKLAEWPDKAQAFLPQPDLDIHLGVADEQEQRQVRLVAHTPTGAALIGAVAP